MFQFLFFPLPFSKRCGLEFPLAASVPPLVGGAIDAGANMGVLFSSVDM